MAKYEILEDVGTFKKGDVHTGKLQKMTGKVYKDKADTIGKPDDRIMVYSYGVGYAVVYPEQVNKFFNIIES